MALALDNKVILLPNALISGFPGISGRRDVLKPASIHILNPKTRKATLWMTMPFYGICGPLYACRALYMPFSRL